MSGAARIGPNAVTRLIEVLRVRVGEEVTRAIVGDAGLAAWLEVPPEAMVPEDAVLRLHAAARRHLSLGPYRELAWDAGRRTGDYLLAHRIPRLARSVLAIVPPGPAARLLLPAIARHAWTFAGSGRFVWSWGQPLLLTIEDCPLCRGTRGATVPLCAYYAGTFERLFRVLLAPSATVSEAACAAMGAEACRFEARW